MRLCSFWSSTSVLLLLSCAASQASLPALAIQHVQEQFRGTGGLRRPENFHITCIDRQTVTADVVIEHTHQNSHIGQPQGSIEQHEHLNRLIGQGEVGRIAISTPDGSKLLRKGQTGALDALRSLRRGIDPVQDYRTRKRDWEGTPLDPPRVSFSQEKISVSWNGASLHQTWVLEGTLSKEEEKHVVWVTMGRSERKGSETDINLARKYDYYRLTALDANSQPLGMWIVRPSGLVTPIPYYLASDLNHYFRLIPTILIILFFFFTSSTLILYHIGRKRATDPIPPLLPRFKEAFRKRRVSSFNDVADSLRQHPSLLLAHEFVDWAKRILKRGGEVKRTRVGDEEVLAEQEMTLLNGDLHDEEQEVQMKDEAGAHALLSEGGQDPGEGRSRDGRTPHM